MWIHGLIDIKGDWSSSGCRRRGFAGRTPAKSFVAKVCLIVCGSRQPTSVITWVTNSLWTWWKKLITRVSRIVDSKMVCLPTHPRRQGQVTVVQGRGVPCLNWRRRSLQPCGFSRVLSDRSEYINRPAKK